MKNISKLIKIEIRNIPLFAVDEYIFVDNANTALIIEIHSSNLKKIKVHYIIEITDEFNVV